MAQWLVIKSAPSGSDSTANEKVHTITDFVIMDEWVHIPLSHDTGEDRELQFNPNNNEEGILYPFWTWVILIGNDAYVLWWIDNGCVGDLIND